MAEQNQDYQPENERVEEMMAGEGKTPDQVKEEAQQIDGPTSVESEMVVMDQKPALISTGRRVWLWSAIVISVLVLILAVGGIVGTWVTRGIAIDVVNGLMDGVERLAGVGREGAALVEERVEELSTVVGEVETAVDEVAQDVSNKGLILTLLPPEKEQELVATAERIGEVADTILTAIETAVDLYTTINRIPLVDLPQPDPEAIAEIESEVQAIQESVDQLATDIQQFRDETVSEIGRISAAVGEVNGLLGDVTQTLVQVDEDLAQIQVRAQAFAGRFASIATVAAILVTLIQAWVVYALAKTAYSHWQELHNG